MHLRASSFQLPVLPASNFQLLALPRCPLPAIDDERDCYALKFTTDYRPTPIRTARNLDDETMTFVESEDNDTHCCTKLT